MYTNIEEGLLYFSVGGKIDVKKLPKFGEITLKIQDGKIVHIRKIEDERLNHTDQIKTTRGMFNKLNGFLNIPLFHYRKLQEERNYIYVHTN